MSEFKKCPNGHYYQGASCPYCRTSAGGSTSSSTVIDPISGGGYGGPRPAGNGGGASEAATNVGGGGNNTTVISGLGGSGTVVSTPGGGYGGGTIPSNRTQIFDPGQSDGTLINGQTARSTRKLVGWLVTYSLDAMGVDFKLYEGRNIIGHDMDCNITINDGLISGKHAVLLYKAPKDPNELVGKFSITDQQSSNGTIVNGEDIELAPCYLKDGDIIRIGKTVLMLRVALFKQ